MERSSPFSVGPVLVLGAIHKKKSQCHMAVYDSRSQDLGGDEREVTVCYPW